MPTGWRSAKPPATCFAGHGSSRLHVAGSRWTFRQAGRGPSHEATPPGRAYLRGCSCQLLDWSVQSLRFRCPAVGFIGSVVVLLVSDPSVRSSRSGAVAGSVDTGARIRGWTAPAPLPTEQLDELDTLREEIITVSARLEADTPKLLTLIAECDARTGWELRSYRGCAEWLAAATGIDIGAASDGLFRGEWEGSGPGVGWRTLRVSLRHTL